MSINFSTSLPVLLKLKIEIYNSILVIVNWFIKIVYYEPIKITIDVLNLAKLIIHMVIEYYSLLNLIVINHNSIFNSKLFLLLYYFFKIK